MISILPFHHVYGEIFALISALMWAFVAILYRRLGDKVSPLGMNVGKGLVAFMFLGVLLIFTDTSLVSRDVFLLLGISGLLGITLGDTFFFMALLRLGPRLTLISTALIPVIAVLLAVLILCERPSFISWLGILLTLSGLTWVLWEKTPVGFQIHNLKKGIKYAFLSALCCASGIIFSKIGIKSTSALKATFIRQGWGLAGLVFWGLVSFRLKDWIKPLTNPILLRKMFFAAFLGTFLGTWLCLLALKYADASIATTLNATSPLFILPLSFFILKERITSRAIVGSVIVVFGIGLILLG